MIEKRWEAVGTDLAEMALQDWIHVAEVHAAVHDGPVAPRLAQRRKSRRHARVVRHDCWLAFERRVLKICELFDQLETAESLSLLPRLVLQPSARKHQSERKQEGKVCHLPCSGIHAASNMQYADFYRSKEANRPRQYKLSDQIADQSGLGTIKITQLRAHSNSVRNRQEGHYSY